jgi:hypothetical protein
MPKRRLIALSWKIADMIRIWKVFGSLISVGAEKKSSISSSQDFAQEFNLLGRSTQFSERVAPLVTFTVSCLKKQDVIYKINIDN